MSGWICRASLRSRLAAALLVATPHPSLKVGPTPALPARCGLPPAR
jgi:hypothetical protein